MSLKTYNKLSSNLMRKLSTLEKDIKTLKTGPCNIAKEPLGI